MIESKTIVLKKIWHNEVKEIEKICPKCKKSFKTKSGITGYVNCKDCNSK